MIPRKLTLNGFLSYRDPVSVDLSLIKVACVSGSNGAGKSTLFDAITWALFGRARRNDDAVITDGMESCRVVFEFDYENETYRVDRSKARGKGTVLEFQIKDSGESWKPLTETGVRTTEDRIKDVLRLDYDTFINASFFLQGKADMFAVQTPGKRKEILSSILGLEVWETYREEAARRRHDLQNETAFHQSKLTEVIEELGLEDTRRETLINLEDQLKKTSSLRQAKSDLLDQARDKAKQLAADQEKVAQLSSQSATFEQRIAETTNLLEERQTHLSRIEKIVQTEDEIRSSYKNWVSLRETLSKLDALSTQYNSLILKKTQLDGLIMAEEARLSQERLSLEMQEKEISLIANEMPDIRRSIDEKSTRIQMLRSEIEKGEQIQSELEALIQRRSDLAGMNNQLKEKMDEIKERIDHLQSAHGAECPLCGQDLTEEHKHTMLASLGEDGKKLGDQHRTNKTEIETCGAQIQQLQTELNDLKEKGNSLARLEKELALADQQLKDKVANRDAWEKIGSPRLQEVIGLFKTAQFQDNARKELELVNDQILELGYDATVHEDTRRHELEQRKIEDDYRELEQARTAQDGLHREIDTYQKQIAQHQADLDVVQQSKTPLIQQIAERQKMLPNIVELDQDLAGIQKEENDLRLQVGGARQEVDVLKNLKNRKLDLEKKINETNTSIAKIKVLEMAFGKDGVPALLIEQSLPMIEEQANDILDRLSSGGMSVTFETEREYRDKKRGDKKQTLDIIIRDGAGSREYELFSGGEAFRINFAIRLALSRVLAQRSGARLQTLVIDEGFGSQDAEGRQRLIEAINLVSSDFEKILVITHLEELKDAFPSRIEVEKTSSGSRVEVIP